MVVITLKFSLVFIGIFSGGENYDKLSLRIRKVLCLYCVYMIHAACFIYFFSGDVFSEGKDTHPIPCPGL